MYEDHYVSSTLYAPPHSYQGLGVFFPPLYSTERGKLSFYFCITTSVVRVLHNAPYEHRDSYD